MAAKKPKSAKSGAIVRVRQTRSAIGYAPDQHATLRGLGLGKPGATARAHRHARGPRDDQEGDSPRRGGELRRCSID